jgi:hypothetical protein
LRENPLSPADAGSKTSIYLCSIPMLTHGATLCRLLHRLIINSADVELTFLKAEILFETVQTIGNHNSILLIKAFQLIHPQGCLKVVSSFHLGHVQAVLALGKQRK